MIPLPLKKEQSINPMELIRIVLITNNVNDPFPINTINNTLKINQ
jgi:hypothetical protein